MKDRRKPRPGIDSNWAGGIRLRTINLIVFIAVLVAAAVLIYGIHSMTDNYHDLRAATNTNLACQDAAKDLTDASDYLTNQARAFAVSGDLQYLNNYFEEAKQTKRRDKALDILKANMPESEALLYLQDALDKSVALMEKEYYSMRLVIEAKGYDLQMMPKDLRQTQLTAEDKKLSPEEQIELARSILFDEDYQNEKDMIASNAERCLDQVMHTIDNNQEQSFARMERTMHWVIAMVVLLLLMFLALVVIINNMVVRPLKASIDSINKKMTLPLNGAYELQYMASVYNRMLRENQEHHDRLAYEAIHDRLTGAYNRAGFEERYHTVDKNNIALVLIDIDYFKEINDTYGHSVGDMVLKRVVRLIQAYFRAEDYICRIGGDEFAVIMLFADSSMRNQVLEKIQTINSLLQEPINDLPAASLSVGVAFGDRKDPTDDMFKDADAALYEVKRAGRKGCAFYGEENVEKC